MKKILIGLFLALSVLSNTDLRAQKTVPVPFSWWAATKTNSYIQIPNAPFSTGYARPVAGLAVAGQIFTSDLAGNFDIILDGNFNSGISLNGLNGTRGSPYRFVNKDATFIAGDPASTTFHSFSTTNSSTYVEIYGKSATQRMLLQAGAGESGMAFFPIGGEGSTLRMQNVIGTNIGYCLVLASQGDYSTPTSYRKLVITFSSIDKISTEGEGVMYDGHNGSPYGFTGRNILLHCTSKDKGREGFQDQHVNEGYIFNCTFINSGQSGIAGQTNDFQVHDCAKHVIENCIFDGAPLPFNLFTHDLVVRNCYIRFTSGEGFIGRTDNAYFASPALNNLNGIKVLFENCDIVYDDGAGGTIAHMAQFAERTANYEFKNCNFQKITAIIDDQRVAGFTNTVTGTISTNGNAVVTNIPKPTYKSTTTSSKDYLKVTGYHYNKRRGALTPVPGNMAIVDTWELTGQFANYGASFASLTLPSTVTALLQNGSRVTLPVTWSCPSYNATTPATYRATGTLTTTTGNVNTYSIAAELDVTVNSPPSVKINFGGTSGTYIGTGNWNHVFQSFASGAQTIKGDNSGQTLASLRYTDGTLSGWGVNIVSGFQGDVTGQNTTGLYPATANFDEWTNPGASGGRQFKFTSMTVGHTYNLKIMCSVNSAVGGAAAQTVDITVAGASGGGTFTNFNEKGNVTNLINGSGGVNVVPNASGEILITVTKNTNVASVSVIEITP